MRHFDFDMRMPQRCRRAPLRRRSAADAALLNIITC